MENLRWILIFAGVAILVLLYVSGRSSAGSRRREARGEPDPLLGDERAPRGRRGGASPDARAAGADFDLDGFEVDPDDLQRPGEPARPAAGSPGRQGARPAARATDAAPAPRRVTVRPRAPVHDFESVSEADFMEPAGYADAYADGPAAPPRGDDGYGFDRSGGAARGPAEPASGRAPRRFADGGRGEAHDGGYDADYDDDLGGRHGEVHDDGDGGYRDGHGGYDDGYDAYDDGHARRPGPDPHDDGHADDGARGRAGAGAAAGAGGALGGLGRRIESIGVRLGAGRREAAADEARDAAPAGPAPTKVVTLHVVSPDGAWFDGELIAGTFEARGYAFGEMDIFHSMHRGRIVFSIAKMVEPGRFDPDDLDSFATPGLVMILQLPGPVPADAAFEVLLSEAHELAARLDARVLDGERSTLSKQSAQHMRDDIREFMHRRKYYGGGEGGGVGETG